MRNPLLNDVPKMLHELGISLPELLVTPKSVETAKTDREGVNALQEVFGRLTRVNQGGPVKRRTFDVTPETKSIEE